MGVAVCEICRRLGRREPGDLSRTDGPPVFMVPADGPGEAGGIRMDAICAGLMREHLAEHKREGE